MCLVIRPYNMLSKAMILKREGSSSVSCLGVESDIVGYNDKGGLAIVAGSRRCCCHDKMSVSMPSVVRDIDIPRCIQNGDPVEDHPCHAVIEHAPYRVTADLSKNRHDG